MMRIPPPVDPDTVPRPNHAYVRSTQIDRVQADILQGNFDLSTAEAWWAEQYEPLLRRGYKLRRRFRTDWAPSWLGTDLIPFYCEDSIPQICIRVIDGIRLSDNTRVSIKRVLSTKRNELKMSKYFSDPERRAEQSNHCVAILDIFDSTDKDYQLMVMPYLLELDDPPFSFVDEVLDFIQQTLEGLSYLHKDKIAHSDLGWGNIMMDGEQLFPSGHHPVHPRFDVALRGYSKPLRRRDVAARSPVRYLFIDFEATLQFNDPNKPPQVYGAFGQDEELPELSFPLGRCYDPFPVDIFMLGNVYKRRLVDKYENLAFLKPLTSAMTRRDPYDRITAPEADELFRLLVKTQTWFSRRNRLRAFEETRRETMIRDAASFFREEIILRTWNTRYDLVCGLAASVAMYAVVQIPFQSLTLTRALVSRSIAS